jgi:uncharacterized membrane protein YidH (DUF202 family)
MSGMLAIVLGLPFFLLPIPLGLPIVIVGITLIYSALPRRQQHMKVLEKHAPIVYRMVNQVLGQCENCKARG